MSHNRGGENYVNPKLENGTLNTRTSERTPVWLTKAKTTVEGLELARKVEDQ